MSNLVYIKVDNIATVLASYDQIKVYKSATETGTYSEVSGSGTRPVMNAQDNLYSFTDAAGLTTDFYKATYFNSVTLAESALPDTPFQALPLQQLFNDMQVVVTVSQDIKDTSGHSLGADADYFFTTIYDPMYSSIRRLRLDIGAYLNSVSDDTLNLAIYVASREADALSWDTVNRTALWEHARRNWATCRAEEILLNNLISGVGGMLKAKRLADFSVEYGELAIRNMLDKVKECLNRWTPELMSGGHAVQTPEYVVKGELDIDRPHAGRGWDEAPGGFPVANARFRYVDSRRWNNGYFPRIRFAGFPGWAWGGWRRF